MSASSFILRHRYGGRQSFGSSLAGNARAAADQFSTRVRGSSRVLCPGCRAGSVVEEALDDGTLTGRFVVVVTIPPDAGPTVQSRFLSMASTAATENGVVARTDEALSTISGGRLVSLVPFWFSPS